MSERGEWVRFECQKPCHLLGMRFVPGDNISVLLRRTFRDDRDPGLGSGGPWGWGGYTSRHVVSLAEQIKTNMIVIFERSEEMV